MSDYARATRDTHEQECVRARKGKRRPRTLMPPRKITVDTRYEALEYRV
jgi:hypothetical protein